MSATKTLSHQFSTVLDLQQGQGQEQGQEQELEQAQQEQAQAQQQQQVQEGLISSVLQVLDCLVVLDYRGVVSSLELEEQFSFVLRALDCPFVLRYHGVVALLVVSLKEEQFLIVLVPFFHDVVA